MLNIKYYIAISCLILSSQNLVSQTLSLDSVLENIKTNNPQLKMYDADIQSMDAAAKGAKSWMPPQVSTGFFMTPYNTKLWKPDEMSSGMGNYMVGLTQMIPNSSRLKADFNYMNAMSSVEAENKNYTMNQLKALAKTNYYQWLVLNRKVKIANENLLLLDYMIKSMEIRYQYNMDKLPSYFKAKSQYGVQENMIVMLENDISQKRIVLNTLMARDKNTFFEIDSNYNWNGKVGKDLMTVLELARENMFKPSETIQERVLKGANVQEKVNAMQFPGGTNIRTGHSPEKQKAFDELKGTGLSESVALELLEE